MLLRCYVKVPSLLKTFSHACETHIAPIPKMQEDGRDGEFLFPGVSVIRENKFSLLL